MLSTGAGARSVPAVEYGQLHMCLRVGLLARFLLGLSVAQAQVSLDIRARTSNPAPPVNLRIDKNLVLVPVTVSDPANRLVLGLEKQHFRIFDDKVEQTITQFAMDDAPLAVGLVFDISGSMGTKLHR